MTAKRELVLMVHPGRCGSSVLGSLLNQHPDVFWCGEMFQEPHGREHAGKGLLDWLRAAKTKPPKRMLGIEVKPWFSRFTGWPMRDLIAGLRARFEVHAIILWRRNLLRSLVSAEVAEARQTYHLYGGASAELTTIRLDPQKVRYGEFSLSLLEQLELIELWRHQARALLAPFKPLQLTYEDDIEADPLQAYAKTSRFLGLSPFAPQVRLSRTTPFPLAEVIENWSEIRALLSGTHFESFLEGGAGLGGPAA